MNLIERSTKVFLNVASNRSDIPSPISEFFDYLKGSAPVNELCRKIDESVEDAVKHEEWRDDYMTLLMRDRQNYFEGHAEGFAEGRLEGSSIKIYELVQKSRLTPCEGAEELGISVEELRSKMVLTGYKFPE